MALTERRPGRTALSYAYLMIGIALGSLFVSGVLGSIFCPDVVTGVQHDHFRIGAWTGWIWDAIAVAIFLPTAIRGIRAGVTDRAPWTMLALGFSAIWLGSMFITIFVPVSVYGTDPTEFPWAAGIGAIAAEVLTAILCYVVRAGFFQSVESKAGSATSTPNAGPGSAALNAFAHPGPYPEERTAAVRLRELAQLRDSGVVTSEEYEAKKKELLARL